jgi:hypothetical protein
MRATILALAGAAFLTASLAFGVGPAAAETSTTDRPAPAIDYLITVRTGTPQGAGTGAKVWAYMYGIRDQARTKSGVLELKGTQGAFDPDSTGRFRFSLRDLGRIYLICLRRNGEGPAPAWYAVWATARGDGTAGYAATFDRWMPRDTWVCRVPSPA